MKATTTLEGAMSGRARKQLLQIAQLLKLSEAKAVEWALKRCGLRIKTPSKFYPEG